MNILNRQPKVQRFAVDDVLQLSTDKNLEHHAEIASTKVSQLLKVAETEEKKSAEELSVANKHFRLAQAQRMSKEKLVVSVISILKSLRR